MVTSRHGVETETVLESVGRVTVIGAFTGVETVALVVWLALVDGVPATSTTAAVGLGILAVGLVVEHTLTDVAVNARGLRLPGIGVLVVSVSEAVLWALWLGIVDEVPGLGAFALACGALALLLVPQHTLEDNVLRGRPLLSRFLDPWTFAFSVVEAAGATAWLLFVRRPDLLAPRLAEFGLSATDPAVVGVGILVVSLFVEHVIGVAYSRRA
jgi:hypothetical protein